MVSILVKVEPVLIQSLKRWRERMIIYPNQSWMDMGILGLRWGSLDEVYHNHSCLVHLQLGTQKNHYLLNIQDKVDRVGYSGLMKLETR